MAQQVARERPLVFVRDLLLGSRGSCRRPEPLGLLTSRGEEYVVGGIRCALFLAGVSAWWLGRGEEAGSYLERASALEPGNAEFRETLRRFRSGTLSR